MIENLDNERVFEELQGENYGNHSIDADELDEIINEGAFAEYENTRELLTDISTAAQRIKARDTREKASELVEEYCSELNLTDEASNLGLEILDHLDEEPYLNHGAQAIAASSTYFTSKCVNDEVTIKEVIELKEIKKGRFRDAWEEIKNQIAYDGAKIVSDFPG